MNSPIGRMLAAGHRRRYSRWFFRQTIPA